MKETSYPTDPASMAGFAAIATTIGNYLCRPGPNDFASGIYNGRAGKHAAAPFGETTMPQVSQTAEEIKIMGDRSPKSNQKKSTQKQSKVSSAASKKKQAVAAKQAVKKK